MRRQPRGNSDRKGWFFADPLVSAFLAGVLLFALIVVGYLVFLHIELALTKPRREHLFQVFLVRGERVCGTTQTRLDMFSLYEGEGSSEWADYEYSGRMMVTDVEGGIGVDFLVQEKKGEEAFYRLHRVGETSDFRLCSHGFVVGYSENMDTRLCPKPWTWYRFKIRAEEKESQTRIRAKMWQEHTLEPETWKVDYLDNSPDRNARGSIGIEATGRGEKFFDDLLVSPIGSEEQGRQGISQRISKELWNGMPLFKEDFEGYPVGSHPIGWREITDTMDLSDVADNLSRFFGMNLIDFAGPWDEVVDLGAMCLVFGLAGLVAGIVGKKPSRPGSAVTSGRRASRVLLTFVPFLLLFGYACLPKGMLVILCVPAAVLATLVWTLLERAVAVVISPSG